MAIQRISEETGIENGNHTQGLDGRAAETVMNSHELCTILIFPQNLFTNGVLSVR
jgi:hypothetical protein